MGHRRNLQSPTAAFPKEGEVHERRHHNFTIELFLDEMGQVNDIFIDHNQSQKRKKISGWEPEKLVDFIAEHTGLLSPKLQPDDDSKQISTSPAANSIIEQPQTKRSMPSKASSDLTGKLYLRELKIVPVDTELPTYLLPKHRPFSVRLALDLTDVVISKNTPLLYDATVLVKELGGAEHAGGKSHARVQASQNMIISVPCDGLPQGIYRFSALVKLRSAKTEHEHTASILAFLDESEPVEVY